MRIQQACRLLNETPRPLKTIAAELGFDDPYYFSRLFRKVTGSSPTGFRQNRASPTRRRVVNRAR